METSTYNKNEVMKSVFNHIQDGVGCFKSDKTTPFLGEELPLRRAIRGEETEPVIMFITHDRHQDGGTWLQISGMPLYHEDGILCGGFVLFQDLNESKQLLDSLKYIHAIMSNVNNILSAI